MVRRALDRAAPDSINAIRRFRYLRRQALQLGRVDDAVGLSALFDEMSNTPFSLQQVKSEFVSLLQLVRERRPTRVLEIGAFQGGSLCLFCRAIDGSADILSIDTAFQFPHRWAYRCFARPRQRVTCLTADSHQAKTLDRVKHWLGHVGLDFLFIDGDHSFEGVARDFEMYSPLVRSGGLIAFHDIVPDFHTRFGRVSSHEVGEVPRFWQQLKRGPYHVHEIVADPQQDGFGFGIVEWNDRRHERGGRELRRVGEQSAE